MSSSWRSEVRQVCNVFVCSIIVIICNVLAYFVIIPAGSRRGTLCQIFKDGPDADRWDNDIQRAFYNGWKSIHGLKHQTVDNAYGMTIDMHGPTSLRRNDLLVLACSRLIPRLNALYEHEQLKILIYGDSIYPHIGSLISSHRNRVNTPRQKLENNTYKSVRVSIEWNYGNTANLFNYLKNLDKLRLLNNQNCVRFYRVCTLLKNCVRSLL